MGSENSKAPIFYGPPSKTKAQICAYTETSESNRQILQDFVLVWLDVKIDESDEDFCNSLEQLRNVVTFINTYKNVKECLQFIENTKDEKVFMIVSGALGENIVPKIERWPQMDSIYIFCNNVPYHEQWSKKFGIIKGVFNDIQLLCNALKADRQRCDQNMMPLSFQDIDPLFMYTQLVKEAILQVEDDGITSIKEFVEFCRSHTDIPKDQIQWVENEYHLHRPIWWYTAPTFMYFTLNRGLRIFNVNILLKMGFFLRQLHHHIDELYHEQQQSKFSFVGMQKNIFTVFRGQGLSKENFKKLNETKEGYMSFNSFLSTSHNREICLRQFARPAILNTDFVSILFVMEINASLCKKANIPFIEITGEIGFFQDREAEVLFSTHTLFKVKKITPLPNPYNNQLYEVNLTIADPNDHKLNEVAESLSKEIGTRTGLSRLANVLKLAGLFEESRQLYHVLLEKATSEDDMEEYNYQLGSVYYNLGENATAIAYYEKYYESKRKTLPPKDPAFSHYYNNIGLAYYQMGEYCKALESHEQALRLRMQVLSQNHPDLAVSYNNIALVYIKMGEYSKALEYCKKDLEIVGKVLPSNCPSLATTYNNIGSVYNSMGEYPKALSSYKQALDIRKIALPPRHIDLACSYNNIGAVYENMKQYSTALSFYEQSLEIKKESLPKGHLETKLTEENIDRVRKKF